MILEKLEKDIYMNLSKKYQGFLEVKLKFPVVDKKALSLVYTPGVAASCLEINKNINEAYKYTNKLNSMLIITDSSAGDFKTEKWNDFAAIPYLEGLSVIYKKAANIDCYPLIIKSNEIKDNEEFFELIDKISLSFSGIEFYNVNEELVQNYLKRKEKFLGQTELSSSFAIASSVNKQNIKCNININLVYAAAFRLALDCQAYIDLNGLISTLIEYVNKNFEPEKIKKYEMIVKLIEVGFDYIKSKNAVNPNCGSYYVNPIKDFGKEHAISKYLNFIVEGERGWVCSPPENHNLINSSTDKNSLVLHQRYRGVIETSSKVPFQSIEEFLKIFTFENFKQLSDAIIVKPHLAKEITCSRNLGAIITNGTAILGLGDIGALAGMPVMEGKSVLFKLYGGTDIIPICIQEKNQEKLVRLCSLITPILSCINLEDIKSPECFYVEPELNKLCDFPVFHDDQHGTAIVCLAAVINALKLTNKNIADAKVVMNGAGAAGLSVARLLITYGCKNFIICDTKGALYKDRTENMNAFKKTLADISNLKQEKGKLEEVIKGADIFVGLSQGGALKKEMVKSMNEKPIILALANPTPEIFPNEAKEAGAFIVGTGRSDFPNQVNNSMAFPGIFRSILDIEAKEVDLNMKIAAAEGIANSVSKDELNVDKILPSAMDTNVFVTVAKSIAMTAEKEGKIRKRGFKTEDVEETYDSWFHEGYLTNKTKF